MVRYALRLELLGYTVRSGGADGADTAFEVAQERRIYLPWAGFNGKKGIVCGQIPSLRDIAMTYHPAWHKLSPGAKRLMTRNTAQVLGYYPETEHSEFVVCWTPRGDGGGGTGQALRIARAYQIPTFDLASPRDAIKFEDYVRRRECV